MLIYGYLSLLLVTLTMFNLIVLGVMIVYLLKLISFLDGAEMGLDQRFRNQPFRRFIDQENREYDTKF